MTSSELNRVLGQVLGPGAPEVGCDECFDGIDRFVELELAGEQPDRRLPGFRAHLAGCPACREEYESLRALASQHES